MESQFKRIYEGSRWSLLYGSYSGLEKTAVIELQRLIQYYVPYTLEVMSGNGVDVLNFEHLALVGTRDSNHLIAQLIDSGKISEPVGDEAYYIAVLESPWCRNMRIMVVAGADERGVFYGVQEMVARVFCGGHLLDGAKSKDRAEHLESIASFSALEKPAITNRGLWTWGYVINSYKKYLRNMARLKMNTLIIWNDRPPLNIDEVIEYAHTLGIRAILGFHWGWGHRGSINLASEADRLKIRNHVLETYRTQYAHLRHDGIYFQTLTEHSDLLIEEKPTAFWVRELVNGIAGKLLEKHPDLKIYFGLHATSIGEHYRELSDLNPNITIVWEDCCGQIPYSYYPVQNVTVTAGFEGMLEYSKRIATFRPGQDFFMVAKGWPCIRWSSDFENHGNFILGEKSGLYAEERLLLRQNEWDKVNCHWHEHFGAAAHFYREMLKVNPCTHVVGLVEDAMFEEKIQTSVSLFAETLWNPHQEDIEIMRRALRPCYYRIPAE